MTRTIKPQALKRLKMTYKSNTGLLLPPIMRHVMRRAANLDELDDERRQDIMHPSDMSKPEWCPRADFYRITRGLQKGGANPSFSMENVFDEGHRIHRKWQGWLWDMGLLYGRFECEHCEHIWWDIAPPECVQCGNQKLRYREIPLESTEYMVAGHSDGGVLDGKEWIDLPGPVLIEVKSLSLGTLRFEAPLMYQRYLDGLGLDELWRDIKRPFASHVKQGLIYCWLAEHSPVGWLPPGFFKQIVFIYECKWNQQAKEFVVTPNYAHIKDILAQAKDVAAGVRQGMEPYRPPWAVGPDGPICTSCPYRRTCWKEEDEKTQEVIAKPLVIKARPAVRRKALRSTQL